MHDLLMMDFSLQFLWLLGRFLFLTFFFVFFFFVSFFFGRNYVLSFPCLSLLCSPILTFFPNLHRIAFIAIPTADFAP